MYNIIYMKFLIIFYNQYIFLKKKRICFSISFLSRIYSKIGQYNNNRKSIYFRGCTFKMMVHCKKWWNCYNLDRFKKIKKKFNYKIYISYYSKNNKMNYYCLQNFMFYLGLILYLTVYRFWYSDTYYILKFSVWMG